MFIQHLKCPCSINACSHMHAHLHVPSHFLFHQQLQINCLVFVCPPIKAASFHTDINTNFTNALSPRWTGSRGGGKLWKEQEMMQKLQNVPLPASSAHWEKTRTRTHTLQLDLTKGRWKQEVLQRKHFQVKPTKHPRHSFPSRNILEKSSVS